jgi:hypothetical protein
MGQVVQQPRGQEVRQRSAAAAVLLALLPAAIAGGCVERRYTIRTNPPGALVFVNGEEIGPSPVSRSFTYWAPREIVLVADGYQTQRIIQPMRAPWWDNIVTEFFSENLVPFTLRDDREYEYQMSPAIPTSEAELEARADALRSEGQVPPPPRRRGLLGWLGFR